MQSERQTQNCAHRMHAADLRTLKVMLRAGFGGLHRVLVQHQMHVHWPGLQPSLKGLARPGKSAGRIFRGQIEARGAQRTLRTQCGSSAER